MSTDFSQNADQAVPSEAGAIAAQRRAMLMGLGGLAAGAMFTRSVQAGPLTPPAGPITATPGPEPRTPLSAATTPNDGTCEFLIQEPGSYYLTGNVAGEAGRNGIVIAASDVTLDLNGFTVQGVAGALVGVATNGVQNNVRVMNGVVAGWPIGGVLLDAGGAGAGCSVEHVIARGNAGVGIQLTSGVVRACIASNNGDLGIFAAGEGNLIENCQVHNNTFTGIQTGPGATVLDCVARANASGILGEPGTLIARSTAVRNSGTGIASSAGLIVNCMARSNNAGFVVSNGGTIESCRSTENQFGIAVIGTGCTVRGSSCGENSSTGILVDGSFNIIDGNSCRFNQIGISVAAPSQNNVITRNVCALQFTRNYQINTNNACLVVAGARTTAAINGNSGGTQLGSTDPYVNFAF